MHNFANLYRPSIMPLGRERIFMKERIEKVFLDLKEFVYSFDKRTWYDIYANSPEEALGKLEKKFPLVELV